MKLILEGWRAFINEDDERLPGGIPAPMPNPKTMEDPDASPVGLANFEGMVAHALAKVNPKSLKELFEGGRAFPSVNDIIRRYSRDQDILEILAVVMNKEHGVIDDSLGYHPTNPGALASAGVLAKKTGMLWWKRVIHGRRILNWYYEAVRDDFINSTPFPRVVEHLALFVPKIKETHDGSTYPDKPGSSVRYTHEAVESFSDFIQVLIQLRLAGIWVHEVAHAFDIDNSANWAIGDSGDKYMTPKLQKILKNSTGKRAEIYAVNKERRFYTDLDQSTLISDLVTLGPVAGWSAYHDVKIDNWIDHEHTASIEIIQKTIVLQIKKLTDYMSYDAAAYGHAEEKHMTARVAADTGEDPERGRVRSRKHQEEDAATRTRQAISVPNRG